ncbi:NAD(P)/FAD-dependent oxidoreductase [Calidithermus roseus]|uniref:Gamma-glutamylputrescine oxidoreductase n=1 Tax=Calidithermus roseus TaxID=1644118 RepID=A0A399EKN1_9DEIN|nr:FAD-dependent oxidoreductase [Calidithermus roseus]RIH83649.1 Gamma-glutamylputrescine oxidoreductase [Calidithermus roseus]
MKTYPANTPVWDDLAWPGLPALEGDLETGVCVVGLGGSGLSALRELLELGQQAVGIDAGPVAGGAAGRNGGFLLAGLARFYHESVAQLGRERARAIYQATLEQLERMRRETPEAIRQVGSLRIAGSEKEYRDCLEHLQALRADGFPAEPYDGPEGRGILIPSDGVFNPLLRCRLLAQGLLRDGVPLFEHTPALEIGSGVVRTPGGSIRCERVIVAVDGGLERLFPELTGRVRTARLQMLATAPAPEVSFPRPVYYRWGYEYWQQLPDGRIALGGFRDQGGEAEWTYEAEPAEEVQGRLERFLRERLGVRAEITHRWAALVAYTDTGWPILEEVRPKVWAIGAYSGTGNVVGAIWGRQVARLAVGALEAGLPLPKK